MAEIAFLIIAIALAAFLIALIPTLLRTRHVVKEVEETVAVLRTDINVTLHQTNEILAKANVLVEDVNEKVQTIDPLFVAVAELSESVSDLNTEARYTVRKQVQQEQVSVKQVQPLLSVRLLQNYLVKKTRKNKEVFS